MQQISIIPKPKTYGPLKNIPHIKKGELSQTFWRLADELGPIFQFEFSKATSIFVSSHELAKEVFDERRFDKFIGSSLNKVRTFSGDGLFTSWTEEPNWRKAHHILMPAFSQQAMKGYHEMMLDIATQLVQKWQRTGRDEEIEVAEDMTKLTLDTIGLCGFDFRFNSFYKENQHPFIESMLNGLNEAMDQASRLPVADKLMIKRRKEFEQDVDFMKQLVDDIIQERKKQDKTGNDLLSLMLHAKDPETGERLSDENIRYQIITFLIAGHETTSGLLSFAIYFLLKNPDKLKKAVQEADNVLQGGLPTFKQVQKLSYTRMVLNEALRLWPTAPTFSLYAKEDTVIGGKYPIQKNQSVNVLLPKLHRDQAVWGEDAEEFKPERFMHPEKIPQHAYKPFGNGQRACIGMQFALHEATMVLAMVLHNLELIDHTSYELDLKESLTIKPNDFKIKVRPRKQQFFMAPPKEEPTKSTASAEAKIASHGTPLLVLYGSNLGTAKQMANEFAEDGKAKGFDVTTAPLDDYTRKLPESGVVLIVTASYNGHPPDHAKQFVDWVTQDEEQDLSNVTFAVFGCGDRNWASTYQRIPRLIDEALERKGAKRVTDIGEGDAGGDMDEDKETFQKTVFDELAKEFNLTLQEKRQEKPNLSIAYTNELVERPVAKTYGAFSAVVLKNQELQSEKSTRQTRHIELQLPEGKHYKEGDHIGIVPKNSATLVQRVTDRFKLDPQQHMILSSEKEASHLPLNQPIQVEELLASHVELQEPVTRTQLRDLAKYTVCPPHRIELEQMAGETYQEALLKKRVTMLDLLEQYEACELPFDHFLALLPGLKPRYYSISSSPKVDEKRLSITVAVVKGKSWSGRGEYAGVASNYLCGLQEGDEVACFLHEAQAGFELPPSPEIPMIMIGPGTGIAPFRGFIQAREAWQNEGKPLGEAHLYFGCRHPHEDDLYYDEMQLAEEKGVVTIHRAYSRYEEQKVYVQHFIKNDGAKLIKLLDKGAYLYICGDGKVMAPDVEATLIELYQTEKQCAKETAEQWLTSLANDNRYVKDVWS
ncbi:bifunctional cytochrome P450/NADPH--P450 reductase [Bacillus altitudinis]|uniref:bifunctional cytochrome P450/NADPH--P450 reductase n=1 Tax=Bacillus altitudinis TaxID=293387 RepID=UPI0022820A50|nr:bifunctional cytochrome P450/NADPH--P450 reductase [Bacillus altitudinis]MCY7579902.1 bifunctional cytochrome P450/NADPH--P450 reductase [Bacillus altitudinis]MCY7593661.1 bifunctional cytochrome P450/NADPH--P450 reductase [Bacillus altitudinis]